MIIEELNMIKTRFELIVTTFMCSKIIYMYTS